MTSEDMKESIPPAEGHRNPRALWSCASSFVVQNRADAAILGEQRVAAEAEQVQVERLVALLVVVALYFDGDDLRRLAGGEGQRAGFGDVVGVARFGIAAGAQTERRGEAGPVRVLLRGWDAPAAVRAVCCALRPYLTSVQGR